MFVLHKTSSSINHGTWIITGTKKNECAQEVNCTI